MFICFVWGGDAASLGLSAFLQVLAVKQTLYRPVVRALRFQLQQRMSSAAVVGVCVCVMPARWRGG